MCGIAGILHYGHSPAPVEERALLRMREAMSHRGPDGKGLWVARDKRIGLAHRRLAIVDLSPEAGQPMASEDGHLQLVFNGMIYNHLELRSELKTLGVHRWRTDHSDTEVLLRAWELWGIDCLSRLRGMFGFALWDNRLKELWLVRDRLGIKPLYFAEDHHGLAFASEINALLVGKPALRQMHPPALTNFLHYGYTPGVETPFRGIKRLMPGCWMHIRADGSSTVRNYWDVLDQVRPCAGKTETTCAEEVLSLLRQSVREHNLSDVPLGLLLSGGIDSSAIAALSVAEAGRSLPSFTIGYDGTFPSCPDETGYARLASAWAGTAYHQKTVSREEFEAAARPLVTALAEPCSVYHLPMFAVVNMARRHEVRVLQGGEGADEIFLGYHPYLRCLAQEKRRFSSPINSDLRRLLGRLWPVSLAGLTWALPSFTGTREALNLRRLPSVLGTEMRRVMADNHPLTAVAKLFEHFRERSAERSMQQWMGYLDLHMRLSSSLLPKLDVITMQHGIECRLPFLDHRLVELAFSLPGTLKMQDQQGKVLLKTAVRGLIPDAVIDRNKQGLFAPFQEWFKAGLGVRMRKEVLDFTSRTGLLERRGVEEVFSADARRAWYLYSFALWYRQHIENDSPGDQLTSPPGSPVHH